MRTTSDVYQWARARIQEASELVRRAPSAVSDQKRLEYELKRNAFLLESGKPITTATLMIQLKRPYTPEELGHYRVLLEITDLHRPGDPKPPSLWFAGQNLPNWRGYSMRTHVWSRSPDVTFHRRVLEADKTTEIPLLRISQDINHTGPFQTLDSLNRKHVNVFVTESLADKIEVVGFTADGYLLMGISMKCLEGTKRAPFEPWPIQVSKAEEQIEWLHRGNLEERLRHINDAQDRLIDGGYGVCVACGDRISEQRLLADPAASMCFDCQRIAAGEMLCRAL